MLKNWQVASILDVYAGYEDDDAIGAQDAGCWNSFNPFAAKGVCTYIHYIAHGVTVVQAIAV